MDTDADANKAWEPLRASAVGGVMCVPFAFYGT